MNGYMGKILRVDLTTGEVVWEDLDPDFARLFLGGAGLGVRLAYDRIDPDCDPSGPENKVIFATRPLTATRFPTASRFQVVCRSPLTNNLRDSSSDGFWGDAERAAIVKAIKAGDKKAAVKNLEENIR